MRDFVPVRSFLVRLKSTVRPRRRDIAAPTCDIPAAALRDVPRRDFLDVDANCIRRVASLRPCVRSHCRLYRHREAEDQSRYYCKPHGFTLMVPLDEAHHASKSVTPGVLADALCVTPLFPPTVLGRSPAAPGLRPFCSSARVAPRGVRLSSYGSF